MVVVKHRDRLCRFAYELVEHLFRKAGTKIVVLSTDTESEPNPSGELAEDLLAITTVFVARNNGMRSAQNRRKRTSRDKEKKDKQENTKKDTSGKSKKDSCVSRQTTTGDTTKMVRDGTMDVQPVLERSGEGGTTKKQKRAEGQVS